MNSSNANIGSFPSWSVLNAAGFTVPPNDWAIFALSLVVSGIAYGWRKYRAR